MTNKYFEPQAAKSFSGTLRGQFVLSKQINRVPEGWNHSANSGWHLAVRNLPIHYVESRTGEKIGWCLGYPIRAGGDVGPIVLPADDSQGIGSSNLEQFYAGMGGRFILILITASEEKLFLDAYGSLGAVYAENEPIVASTPALCAPSENWDDDLIGALGIPESDAYFPFGLTARLGIKRLLPNHFLDLRKWVCLRWSRLPGQ